MLTQPEHDSETPNYPLVGWTSLIAAGAITVIWKAGVPLNHDSTGTFLLFSFLAVEQIAAIFVYHRAEKQRLMHVLMAIFFIPICILAITLLAVFAEELVYGGSGYHGEYMFPFLQRS